MAFSDRRNATMESNKVHEERIKNIRNAVWETVKSDNFELSIRAKVEQAGTPNDSIDVFVDAVTDNVVKRAFDPTLEFCTVLRAKGVEDYKIDILVEELVDKYDLEVKSNSNDDKLYAAACYFEDNKQLYATIDEELKRI